ncbi:class F sortase [Actinoplanes oblitus]|uniref:Class F sortase n=1 Tax=Actinoplanes oblitus TaxID=3040509 RepID=A0ABY8WPY9_9ACTN|nr:class F sortase [Actinoplanes oblitus]WIM99497.1 class F sortase [Actinoplanes oblitus]
MLVSAAPAVAPPSATPGAASAGTAVQVRLFALNDSGASGTATLTALPNGDLAVSIRSTHLVPNAAHAQHLHGSTTGMNFHCPSRSADRDHEGYLTTEEGMPDYGDIFLSLTTRGDISRASGLAVDRMPVADARGALAYDRTIPAADLPPGTVEHLPDLHIVEHGIDVNQNRRYDLDGLGESTFAAAAGLSGIPEEATDPALCGMVSGAAAGSVPVGGIAAGDGSVRTGFRYGYGGLVVLGVGVVLYRRRRASHHRDVGLLAVLVCGRLITTSPAGSPTAPIASSAAAPALGASAGIVAGDASALISGPLLPESPPARLEIPALRVAAPVAALGLEPDGTMRVPTDARTVGWFTRAPVPGSLGPAVLAGHVDYRGAAGSFARLSHLRRGAAIRITRRDGTVAVFAVDRIGRYPKSAFPAGAVYGPIDHAGLRLVTCGGDFDRDAGHYVDNVVVFASLRDSS